MRFTTPSFMHQERDGRSASPELSVIAIYDGFTAGIHAQEAVGWLKHSLGPFLQVHSDFWSFQNLERLDVRAMSLHAAASAHLIIISASESEPLPVQVTRWLDSVLQEQGGSRALLVALHDGDQEPCEEPGPFCSYLQHQARRWQTDCLCNEEFDRRLNRDFALQFVHTCGRGQSFNGRTQPRDFDREQNAVGWGINER